MTARARADHIRDVHRAMGVRARGQSKPDIDAVLRRLDDLGLPFIAGNDHTKTQVPLHITIHVDGEPVMHIWPTTCAWTREGLRGRFYGDFWPQVERLAAKHKERS